MKQIVQNIRSGETAVIEVPAPRAQPKMALVRTVASLVSAGTERALVEFAGKSLLGKARSRPDLVRQVVDKVRKEGLLTAAEAVRSRLDQPMPLGYASAGRIVEVGEGIGPFRVGDRVACAGGGYATHAEYAVVPRNLLTKLPDSVDFEAGAFATLGAIALHGFRLASPQVGELVGVIGLGVLGHLAVGIAKAAGCKVLAIDKSTRRVEIARDLGIDVVDRDNAEQVADAFSQGNGFDVVLICADAPLDDYDTVELAGTIAANKGRVVSVGVVGTNLPRSIYYGKELTFQISRSYGPGRYDPDYEEGGRDYPIGFVRWTEGRNLQAFVGLLAEAKVEVKSLISHRFPIDKAEQAYDLISGKTGEDSLGVLLTYPDEVDSSEQPSRLMTIASSVADVSSAVKLGVIGAGQFANAVLLPAVKRVAGIERVGLATATGGSSLSAGRRFGFKYATTDVEELLGDEHVNTVAVLTRHNLHAPYTIEALKAGKHVFCEKPLAITREDVLAIAKALNESDRLLMVGFNRRFAPLARYLNSHFIDSYEPLSMHYRINAGYLPRDHWIQDPEQGGGRIVGEVCHFIDFLTFINGDPPERIRTSGLPDRDRYQEDNVHLTLEFPDGSLGTITYLASGDRGFPKERVEIFGGGRVGVLDDFRRLETIVGNRRKVRRSWLRQDKGHRAEWEAFKTAVATGGPPPIPHEHLFAVTMASFAALQSLRTGETVSVERVS